MIAVTYRVVLLEPLLATALDGDPNSAVSYAYIPGSLIRGLMAGLLLKQSDQPEQSGNKDLHIRSRPWLFDGTVRYLNAYPVVDSQNRLLPVPLSWQVEKHLANEDVLKIYDFALLPEDERPDSTAKGVDGFTHFDGSEANRYQPARQIAIHTLRNREAGRATDILGAVYRYESLAPGEVFQGAILVASMEKAKDIESYLMPGIYQLGGAQTGGYGKVEIDEVRIDAYWNEYQSELADILPDDEFYITLLSDTLLRNKWGAIHSNLVQALPWKTKLLSSYKGFAPVGGFNRKWGLPLPQEQAIQAGSVFVLQAQEKIGRDALEQLIESGIGERRAEGFGRIAINWQEADDFQCTKAIPLSSSERIDREDLSEVDKTLIQRMETRRYRRDLDRILVTKLPDFQIIGDIPNTQLSRIRIIARSALQSDGLGRIASLFGEKYLFSVDSDFSSTLDQRKLTAEVLAEFEKLDIALNQSARVTPIAPGQKWQITYAQQQYEIRAKKETDALDVYDKTPKEALRANARRKFERAKIGNTRLNRWIVDLALHPEQVWEKLGYPQRKPLIPSRHSNPTDPTDLALAKEYTVRLIDGVLAWKMQQKDGRNG